MHCEKPLSRKVHFVIMNTHWKKDVISSITPSSPFLLISSSPTNTLKLESLQYTMSIIEPASIILLKMVGPRDIMNYTNPITL